MYWIDLRQILRVGRYVDRDDEYDIRFERSLKGR